MVLLDELPTETLKQILELTPISRGLLRTNRRINAIATPLYYRDVFLYTDAKDDKKANTMIGNFFRTVRSNRAIAHSVRRICICGSRPDAYKIKFTIDEIDDEEEMRNAGIEDDRIFDELARPKYRMRCNKKQITELRDPDTVIAVTLGRLKNLEILDLGHGIWAKSYDLPVLFEKKYLKNLKKVRFDTEPIPPIMTFEEEERARGPSDWDTCSPYNPKAIHRKALQHLLSLPHMESIACVAADRKYSYNEPFVYEDDMYSDGMNAEDVNAEDMDEEKSDEEYSDENDSDEEISNEKAADERGMNAEVATSDSMDAEVMDAGNSNEESSDQGHLSEVDFPDETDDEDLDVEFGPIEQPYKYLTSLSFERSRMSQSTLRMILEATPRLQKLKYEFWMHTSAMGEFEGYFDCAQMDITLEPVRDTLQELSIGIDYVETFAQGFLRQLGRSIVWGGGPATIRSLVSFPRLTSVEIPHVLLLGWRSAESQIQFVDVLPRTLKSLVILIKKLPYFQSYKWNEGAIFDRLRNLVINKDMHVPDLERIEVTGLGRRYDYMTQYSQLRRASNENGVRLSMGDYEDFYKFSSRVNF